jgi:HAD superfamily phosphatase
MPRPLVVFDVDGVLVDASDSYRETIVRTVERFTGRRVSRALVQEYKNSGGYNNDWKLSRKIVSDLGVEVPFDEVVRYFDHIFFEDGDNSLILRERWIAAPGLFERLESRCDLAIYTGRMRHEIDSTLARLARGVRFDPVLCHEDVVKSKPDPEGLLKIAAALPGRKLWYVGDTVDDARCAKGAGVDFIGIAAPEAPGSAETSALLKAEGAVAVLGDINQLETVL